MDKKDLHLDRILTAKGTVYEDEGNANGEAEEEDYAGTHTRPMTEEEKEQVAESVGISAIRYADLVQNPQTDVQFSWDKLLSLEGNTAPFLMYSYARARGIQRKAGLTKPSVSSLAISSPNERVLIVSLLKFPNAVEHALESNKPNILCDYLYDLCSSFNRFYAESPVLSAQNETVKESRLALVETSLRVLQKCFSLLGIHALDRM